MANKHISRLIDAYLKDLDASPKTILSYRSGLRRFIEYSIRINTGTLQRFHAKLLHDPVGYRPRTRDLYLTALRSFLSWLDAHGKLPRGYSVARAEARLRASMGRRHRPYRHKIPDLRLPLLLDYFCVEPGMLKIERLEALRNNALMHVLFSTAARVSEVASLTRQQVLDGVCSDVVITGKGEKDRIVMLDKPAQLAICAYLQERTDTSPLLFISHRRKKGCCLSVTMIWRIIKAAAKALNLAPNTSPHMVRHYVASDMLNSDVPLEVVQDYLGHSSIETTRTIYAHTYAATLHAHIYRYWAAKSQRVHQIS